jgi:hypothetical protein
MNEMSVFQRVCQMNEKFSNSKGNPHFIDAPRLLRQCKNIGQEFKELLSAFGIQATITYDTQDIAAIPPNSVELIRDALCDIKVFADGAYHFMGYDADRDMHSVIDALYSRFCTSYEHLRDTEAYYSKKGIEYYVEGDFPYVCLKSAKDQGEGEYPKGKFLKAVGYHTPVFYEEPKPAIERKFMSMQAPQVAVAPVMTESVPIVNDMASQRAIYQEHENKIKERIKKQVKEYRDMLEKHALGLPPYDQTANQCGEKYPAQE